MPVQLVDWQIETTDFAEPVYGLRLGVLNQTSYGLPPDHWILCAWPRRHGESVWAPGMKDTYWAYMGIT